MRGDHIGATPLTRVGAQACPDRTPIRDCVPLSDEEALHPRAAWASPSSTDAHAHLDGAREEAVDPGQPQSMASPIPGSTLTVMPDTGHFGMVQQPAEVNRILSDFLAND